MTVSKHCVWSQKTKKSEQVRQYYIALEKLIDQYKDLIIEKQNKEINILKLDLRNDILPNEGYTYIFEETDELGKKYHRIGRSENIKIRMVNHNSSSIHKKNYYYFTIINYVFFLICIIEW